MAYIGASNQDNLEVYHSIFEPAMQQIPIDNHRMILTRPSPEDGIFLEQADIIVLAGGSVETGWRAFEKNGFKDLIIRRFYEGAVLVGISAGAVQLGRGGLTDDGQEPLSTFGLLPFYAGVHDESDNWMSLRNALAFIKEPTQGIGIPSGGGLIYHSDTGVVEPICKPLYDLSIEGDQHSETIIFPDSEETPAPPIDPDRVQ